MNETRIIISSHAHAAKMKSLFSSWKWMVIPWTDGTLCLWEKGNFSSSIHLIFFFFFKLMYAPYIIRNPNCLCIWKILVNITAMIILRSAWRHDFLFLLLRRSPVLAQRRDMEQTVPNSNKHGIFLSSK